MNSDTPHADAIPAAVIILMRDGSSGMEILILRKASGKHFASGALVFPGGKVADADIAFTGDIGETRNTGSVLKIAAIREMYEECGIALARAPGNGSFLDSITVRKYQAAYASAPLLELATLVPLSLAADSLIRFAHWITPPSRPKRFDTHFFVAIAPPEQMEPSVDGYEIVDSRWCRPQDLINDFHNGTEKLVLPTLMNVMKLTEVNSVDEALRMARNRNIIPVTPTLKKTPTGDHLVIPEAAGYGMTEIPTAMLRSA